MDALHDREYGPVSLSWNTPIAPKRTVRHSAPERNPQTVIPGHVRMGRKFRTVNISKDGDPFCSPVFADDLRERLFADCIAGATWFPKRLKTSLKRPPSISPRSTRHIPSGKAMGAHSVNSSVSLPSQHGRYQRTGKPAGFGREKAEHHTTYDYHKVPDEIKPGWDL